MQVTLNVPDKLIKTAIQNMLECNVYDYFDSECVKQAKLPKKSAAVKAIFEDPKFQTQITKELSRIAMLDIEDMLFDELFDIKLALVSDMMQACEEADEARTEKREQEREAEEVARMVKTLERAGYKLVKA